MIKTQTFGLDSIGRTLRERAGVALVVTALVFTAVVVATFGATPKYTAEAQVVIDQRSNDVIDVDAVMSGLPRDAGAIDTEVNIISSKQLAQRVIRKLRLDTDPEFNPALRPEKGLTSLLKSLKAFGASLSGAPPQVADQSAQQRQMMDAVVIQVGRRLTVERVGLSYVMSIAFESDSPGKARDIANAFAQEYIVDQLEAKFDATKTASGWINARLNELRVQMQNADTSVAQYTAANNLMSLQGSTLTEQEISSINGQIAIARATQAEKEARLAAARAQIRAGGGGANVTAALDSDVIKVLRSQRAEVSRRKADLSTRYGDLHPDVLRVNQELQDIDGQIQQEIDRITSNLQSEVDVAHQRTASLEGSLGRSRGALIGNTRAGVKLAQLQGDAEAAKTLYDTFLQRSKETGVQASIAQPDARVSSAAVTPQGPSSPNVKLNLLVGTMLAALMGLAAAFIADALDRGLSSAEQVESDLDIAHLASVPIIASARGSKPDSVRPTEYLLNHPLSAFAESIRTLRASVLYSGVGHRTTDPLVLMITSSFPDEGKSTTAVCLARVMAQAGDKVLLIDCDLRRPSLGRFDAGKSRPGLVEVLAGKAALKDAVIVDEPTGAHILTLSGTTSPGRDIFGSEEMKSLLTQMRSLYGVVLLDTAPVLAVAETRVLSTLADGVIVLAQWKRTPAVAVRRTVDQLTTLGATVLGICLAQVNLEWQSRRAVGDGAYYKRYSKYYGG
jgi:succinoglycan biosynthesis transport protein ExoP